MKERQPSAGRKAKTASLASAVRPFTKKVTPQQANPGSIGKLPQPAKSKFYEAP
ncbi:MAG TPA: hypothetical protein VGF92_07430 [Stellaceae bacterium]|jgi:hypothetical protein